MELSEKRGFILFLKKQNKQYITLDNSFILLYTVCTGGEDMHIIINHTSMTPIYEQIVSQIRADIINGDLSPGTALPSVRMLSRELKISALTVKKAYDYLEEEGLVHTVHGKGSFIAEANQGMIMEERRKELEHDLDEAVRKARAGGLTDEEICDLFRLIMEGE